MKTTPHTLISLSFILFSIAAAQLSPILRDTSENELLVGTEYFVVAATIAGEVGPGITLFPTGNETCPTNVIQEPFTVLFGLPVTFHLINSNKDSVLRLSTDLNIKFETTLPCADSTVWKVDDYDMWARKYFITVGGEVGKPGCESVRNWFRIEKYGVFNKFVYCPNVCETKTVVCKDVGIFVEDGFRRLGLTDGEPFMFVLVKKSSLVFSQ